MYLKLTKMMVSKSSYESIRQERVGENMKRMEEHNLKKVSDDFHTHSPKKSLVRLFFMGRMVGYLAFFVSSLFLWVEKYEK